MYRLVVAICLVALMAVPSLNSAQQPKTGLATADQKKIDELVKDARSAERIGYIAAGVAVAAIVIGIPVSMYFDRKKKAKQRTDG